MNFYTSTSNAFGREKEAVLFHPAQASNLNSPGPHLHAVSDHREGNSGLEG